VTLNDTDEFGVEFGLQDSILFDRSVAGTGSLAGTAVPGFLFNNGTSLGNSNAAEALQNASKVGAQGLGNLGVGRTNSELGFGGLVLSASSDAVSVLIRALKECRRIDVLSRPQIMTMDNQTAEILVGQDVPTISASQFTDLGSQINSITYREVGLILTVTPRISPDKLVVMEIDATSSDVGAESEGIPVSVAQGQVIRSPRINITSARTVISACDAQTVVLGGLITKAHDRTTRKVPYLADIPVVGHLFRYDATKDRKEELLIIMTPHIVMTEDDAERIKRIESSRMDWCLSDVLDIHDAKGLGSRSMTAAGAGGDVIYPDLNPVMQATPMPTPTPAPPQAPAEAATPNAPLPPPEEPALEPGQSPPGRMPAPVPAAPANPGPSASLPARGRAASPRPLSSTDQRAMGMRAMSSEATEDQGTMR
jgi:type II secretory pathway component GspD/PulD (secretin)